MSLPQPTPLRRRRKELAQRQLGAVAGVARPHRQLQQTLGMRSQRCKRREGCPASRERGPRGLPRPRCSVPGACPSESPEQRQRLAIEAPAYLESEDNQATTSVAAWLELGVRAELARLSLLKCQRWPRIGPGSRTPVALNLRFATTSIRRPSVAGTSRFSSRKATLVATRAPASRQMRAAARSSGPARCARTPTWAQADQWSPRLSRRRPHWHRLGASGSARRSFRSSRTRNSSLGTTKSGPVGRTVSAQLAPAPLWDSSSARDAESNSANEKHLKHALIHSGSSAALPPPPHFQGRVIIACERTGLSPVLEGRPCWSLEVLEAEGLSGVLGPSRAGRRVRGGQIHEGSREVPGWHSRKAPITSAQDAQYAA